MWFYQAVWGEVGEIITVVLNTLMYKCDVLDYYIFFSQEL